MPNSTSHTTKKKKFFCTHCEAGYIRKVDFDTHFTLKKVRSATQGSGCVLVDKTCHNRAKRQFGSTPEEARSLKKVRSLPFAPTIASTSQKDQNQEEAHIPTHVTPPVSTVADNSSAILEFLKSMDKKIDQICHDKTTPTSAPAQPSSADSNYHFVLKKVLGIDQDLYKSWR